MISEQCMRTSDMGGPVALSTRGRTLGRRMVMIGEIQLTNATANTGKSVATEVSIKIDRVPSHSQSVESSWSRGFAGFRGWSSPGTSS